MAASDSLDLQGRAAGDSINQGKAILKGFFSRQPAKADWPSDPCFLLEAVVPDGPTVAGSLERRFSPGTRRRRECHDKWCGGSQKIAPKPKDR